MKEVFDRLKKSWNVIKIVSCICLILATFYFGFSYFNKVFRNPDADYGNEFHNLPENSIDIIVLGSSHAQYSFVPSFLYQNTGLYSYVLGTPCQPLKVSYQMLREALKTQSPEMVVLEVYTATPLKEACDGNACYVTAQYQMRDEEKYNTIDFLPEEKAIEYRNEFINNHNNWRTIDPSELNKQKDNKGLSYDFGYVYMSMDFPPNNVWLPMIYDETNEVELEKEDVEALNNIYDMCQENDIQLLLYMTPMDNIDVLNQSYRYKVWDWAKEKEIKYLDFIDMSSNLGLWMQVHGDGFHSSISGANVMTNYLSDFIMDNYEFNNHKDSEAFNEAYSKSICNNTIGVMNTELDPCKYLRRLIDYPGTIIIRYNANSGRLNEELLDLLRSVCKNEEINNGTNYYAVIKNGEVVDYSNDYLDLDIDSHHFEVLYDRITIDYDIINNSNDFSIIAFNESYSAKAIKNINPITKWEKGYSKYYQPSN